MIKRVNILYKTQESITYSFWKYFFESIGIWVHEEEITTTWNKQIDRVNREIQLLILGEQGYKYIKDINIPDNCAIQVGKTDITISYVKEILKIILKGYSELNTIIQLAEIFTTAHIWGAAWLFNELPNSKNSLYRTKINQAYNIATELINKIETTNKIDKYYIKYFQLYIKYIHYNNEINSVDVLLEDCNKLFRLEESPSVWLLAGKICELSTTTNKRAIDMYSHATDFESKPELLYRIGNLYETAYGYINKANSYYKQINTKDYKVLYKQASDIESTRDFKAIEYYKEVKKITKDRINSSECITLREIEYLYKSTNKLQQLCSKHIIDDKIALIYKQQIKNIRDKLDELMNLQPMLNQMFNTVDATKLYANIKEEIRERIK